MSQIQDNFKRGTIELLILHLLSEGKELYGYEICKKFREKSEGAYSVLEGSLYLVLFRMVDNGWLEQRQELVGVKRVRRYYKITESGAAYYKTLLHEYDETAKAINRILDRDLTVKKKRGSVSAI